MRVSIDVRGGSVSWDPREIERVALIAMREIGVPESSELSVSLVGTDEIAALNASWRGVDAPTDVLSLPMDGLDLAAYDESAYDESGYDESAYDESAYDESAYDESGYDESAYDESGYDESAYDESAYDESGYDESAYDVGDVPPVELGDVVMCTDVIDAQRARFGTTFDEEASLMLVHSILHLVGHDHEDESSRAEMEAAEKRILEAAGYPGVR